jgi:hypothetical protein
MRTKGRLIRRSRGTKNEDVGSERFVCGMCHNTGICDLEGGGWRDCHCGLPKIGTLDD